jgi:hypothetical protein
MPVKPVCKLSGQNGNIFNLASFAKQTLEKEGMKEQAKEMQEKIFRSHSYEEALGIIADYVEVE